MMDKYISSRTARIVFKVPVREQKNVSHCHISHMTPVALPQQRAGTGPTSPRFPVLGIVIV